MPAPPDGPVPANAPPHPDPSGRDALTGPGGASGAKPGPEAGAPPPAVRPAGGSGLTNREIGGFELLAKVGHGGMGTVFKARQVSMDRIIALKILPPQLAKSQQFLERFQREARASARLNHPHIVQGIDVGQDAATGLWYFAMEYVDGPSLKKVLDQRRVLPEREALQIAGAIGRALEASHAAGIIHRDVKPDNILLTLSGVAKLADLGLAKRMQDDASLTQSGMSIGTPHYMSPEQIRGDQRRVDGRSDLYALGATLFHLVTGRTPFEGETSAVVLSKHLRDVPPRARSVNPHVSEGCSRLISKLLMKEPDRRVQTAGEFAREVEALLAAPAAAGAPKPGHPHRHDRAHPAEPPGHAAGRKAGGPKAAWIACGAAALVLIAVVALSRGGSKSRPVALLPSEIEPAPSPPAPPPIPPVPPAPISKVDRAELERMLRDAQEWERKNSEAYDELAARYRKVTERAWGTPFEVEYVGKVDTTVAAVRARQAKTAEGAWKPVEEAARAKAAAGDYDGAIAAAAPPKAFAAALESRARQLADTLRREAEGKIQGALEKADAALKKGEPGDGLQALAAVEGLTYAKLAGSVRESKEKLRKVGEDGVALKAMRDLAAAQTQIEMGLANFDAALLEKDDLTAARAAADEAKRACTHPQVKPAAEAMGQIVDAYDDVRRQEAEALKALVGKPMQVGGRSGTIKEVQGDTLVVEIRQLVGGGTALITERVNLKDLPEAQRKSLLPSVLPATDAGKVAGALQKLRKGREDLAGAELLLAAAPRFPLSGRYQELAAVKRRGAAEVSAEKAWPGVEAAGRRPCTTPPEGKALEKVLDDYEFGHGATAFAKSKAGDLAALRKRAERAQRVNLLENNGFEAGKLDPWFTADYGSPGPEVVGDLPSSGKFCVKIVTAPHSALVQKVTVQPGRRYVLTWRLKVPDPATCRQGLEVCGARIENINRATAWTLFEQEVVATEGTLNVWFDFRGTGTVYLDDVCLAAAPSGKP